MTDTSYAHLEIRRPPSHGERKSAKRLWVYGTCGAGLLVCIVLVKQVLDGSTNLKVQIDPRLAEIVTISACGARNGVISCTMVANKPPHVQLNGMLVAKGYNAQGAIEQSGGAFPNVGRVATTVNLMASKNVSRLVLNDALTESRQR